MGRQGLRTEGVQNRTEIAKPPSLAAGRFPGVEILPAWVHVHHGVHGSAAAQHLSARPEQAAIPELGLGFGPEGPVARGAEQGGKGERAFGARIRTGSAGFHQQDVQPRVLCQSRGQHTSRGSGADHDVIKYG